MAEYSKNEVRVEKQKVISLLVVIFGAFIIASALAIFPNDSSWGSIYAIIGGIIFAVGIYFRVKHICGNKIYRILVMIVCISLLLGFFSFSDYITVSRFHQVPRFSYLKSYGEDEIEHKTLFFTVVQKNPGTENEQIKIIK